jgi:hypothetical protein
MKNSIYSIALAALFIFGCNQSPNESDPMQVNDPNHPNSAKSGGTSDAVFDIPTPTMASATQGEEAIGDNYGVTVCWNYTIPASSDYYLVTRYTPQGTGKPERPQGVVPTASLNPSADNSYYEFWGGSQQTIVSSPSYSGHYEVYRSTDGGTTWTKLTDTESLCYTDDNGGAGFAVGTELVYSVKEKSLEGSSPNQCTHHSLMAEGINITIEDPCTEIEQDDTYSPAGIYGDNVVWNGSDFTIGNAGQVNPHWVLNIVHHTINSCTEEETTTPTETSFSGELCVRLAGGPNNIDPATATEYEADWQEGKYHIDGTMNNPGVAGDNYILYYLLDANDDGVCTYPDDVIATSTVTVD